MGPLAEVDLAGARALYEANVFGLLAMVQAVTPHMAARRQGTIVNIGSIVGTISTPLGKRRRVGCGCPLGRGVGVRGRGGEGMPPGQGGCAPPGRGEEGGGRLAG